MLNENIKYEDELSNLMNGLADSVLEMSDEEIEKEFQADEDDSENIRQVLLNSVKTCRQEKLIESKKRHEQNLVSFQNTHYEIPEHPEAKRNLIESMMGNIAARHQTQLTTQFRDFKNLPDEDLDGIIKQLFALESSEENN